MLAQSPTAKTPGVLVDSRVSETCGFRFSEAEKVRAGETTTAAVLSVFNRWYWTALSGSRVIGWGIPTAVWLWSSLTTPTSMKPPAFRESPVSASHFAAPLSVHQIASENGICQRK